MAGIKEYSTGWFCSGYLPTSIDGIQLANELIRSIQDSFIHISGHMYPTLLYVQVCVLAEYQPGRWDQHI